MADQQTQAAVAATRSFQPQLGWLNAESRRTLDSNVYSAGRQVSSSIFRDSIYKRMHVRGVAIFTTTYGSGSPTTSEDYFGRIINSIDIKIAGSRTIKSINPAMMRRLNALWYGDFPRRAHSKPGASVTSANAGTENDDGTAIAFPTTTEYFVLNEEFIIPFELPFAGLGLGKEQTWLDTRSVSSADVFVNWANLTDLQRDGVGATVTYGAADVSLKMQLIEARSTPRPVDGQECYDFVESFFDRSYSGESKNQQVDLQTGNWLLGVLGQVRNGDTNKNLFDNGLKNIKIDINGSSTIQGPVDQIDLQDANQARYAFSDSKTSGYHGYKGNFYLPLINGGDWKTAPNTSKEAGVDSIKMIYDTASSSSGYDQATYTNALVVRHHVMEVRPFIYRS